MTEIRGWSSPGPFLPLMFLISAAMGVAVVFRSATALVVIMGLTVAAAVAAPALRTRRERNAPLPPGLDPLEAEQRRLILAAVHRGARISDPALAPAVVAVARRQRRVHAVFLASGAVPVGFRAADLLSATAGRAGVDRIVVVVWLVAAGVLVRGMVRATQAIAANL